MTTIEKQQFKITIPSIISIILCTASTIMFLYSFFDKNSADINAVKTEVQAVKNSQEIIAIQQKNGFQTINNSRKRDSTDGANGRQEIKQEIKDLHELILRLSPYNQRPVTTN